MLGSEFSTLVFGDSSVALEGPWTLGFEVLGFEYLDTAGVVDLSMRVHGSCRFFVRLEG